MRPVHVNPHHVKKSKEMDDNDPSKNDRKDLENIEALGEGWVAEETLATAVYCSLKYQDNFSKALCTSVNHSGDSDSTGAVTGNILGAWIGYNNIPVEWKENLECFDIILEIADDLYASETKTIDTLDIHWTKKYIRCKKESR